MTDIEKMLTEVREAALPFAMKSSTYERHRLANALAAFTAEMPGAIGWFVERGLAHPHNYECQTYRDFGAKCRCGGDAALANLEGK